MQYIATVISKDHIDIGVKVQARTLSQLVAAQADLRRQAATMNYAELLDFYADEGMLPPWLALLTEVAA